MDETTASNAIHSLLSEREPIVCASCCAIPDLLHAIHSNGSKELRKFEVNGFFDLVALFVPKVLIWMHEVFAVFHYSVIVRFSRSADGMTLMLSYVTRDAKEPRSLPLDRTRPEIVIESPTFEIMNGRVIHFLLEKPGDYSNHVVPSCKLHRLPVKNCPGQIWAYRSRFTNKPDCPRRIILTKIQSPKEIKMTTPKSARAVLLAHILSVFTQGSRSGELFHSQKKWLNCNNVRGVFQVELGSWQQAYQISIPNLKIVFVSQFRAAQEIKCPMVDKAIRDFDPETSFVCIININTSMSNIIMDSDMAFIHQSMVVIQKAVSVKSEHRLFKEIALVINRQSLETAVHHAQTRCPHCGQSVRMEEFARCEECNGTFYCNSECLTRDHARHSVGECHNVKLFAQA